MKIRLLSSLQSKLLLSLFTIVAIAGVGMALVGKAIIDKNIISQAYEQVGQALGMYGELYANRLTIKNRLLATVASYPQFRADVRNRNNERIFRVIAELLSESTFDILNVTDEKGRVLVRSKGLGVTGDDVSGDPYVRAVLKSGKPVSGFDVMDRAQLLRESPEIADRAVVPVVPTDRARASEPRTETRGLFLKSACPVLFNGELVGVIYGALLLNNDTTLPDMARSLVFGDEQVNGRDIGTVTLFLGDVRISTNVRDSSGRRAIGTLVSDEVYKRVLEEGATWRDKAFVVDRWFIAAYKPVRDLDQRIVGIMYTGILEEKFYRIQREAAGSLALLIGLMSLASFGLTSYLIHVIIKPVTALVKAAGQISAGRRVRVEVRSDDEMGRLSRAFNMMLDALEAKEKQAAEDLEMQIEQTEKLASVGRLASGIAHEINNPLTGVLTYSDALLEDLEGTEYAEDLRVIRNETLRCRQIVRGVLDFARETTLEKTKINLNQVIEDVLAILEKHVAFQNIRVIRQLDSRLPDIWGDVNQLKSVVNNLAMNAADAMPNGGPITFTTETAAGGESVVMRVRDRGHGIKPEDLGRVFDPFFTTKETGKGTGLGLSVTYGIVKRHNGNITISSQVNQGTTVEVRLPIGLPDEESCTPHPAC
ncbi:MAG: cache domain-containing protein [Vicinamibacterales bacterium]